MRKVKIRKEEFEEKVKKEYAARKKRKSHPDGIFEKGNRWFPSDDEKCDCCKEIRWPSWNYPFSLMVHCRTKKHVRNLFLKDHEIVEEDAQKKEFGKKVFLASICTSIKRPVVLYPTGLED